MSPLDPVRIGVSACLLGHEVRFDGGHKRDRFLTDTFGRFVEWVSVCPEEEAGLGTPREPMHLVNCDGRLRLQTVETGIDLTDRLERYAQRRVEQLARERLSGYVLKKNSPSCGLQRVKVYTAHRVPTRSGRGLFASALRARLPCLPIEEEGRLSDPRIRDNFVERVFAYRRMRAMFATRWTTETLVRFHTSHRLALMAHSVAAHNKLGQLIARAKSLPRPVVETRYCEGFMTALQAIATTRRHTNVLQHMASYLEDVLEPASRTELAATIADYRLGRVPLIVPITLVRHHIRRFNVPYLSGQTYVEPEPEELTLRNHA